MTDDSKYQHGWRRWATGGQSPRDAFSPAFIGVLIVVVLVALALGVGR